MRNRALVGLVLLLATPAFAASARSYVRFEPGDYLRHLRFLAADASAGRAPGTPEIERAADYIAAEFASYGLLPAGEDGTFFQRFAVTAGKELRQDDADLSVDEIDRDWKVREDWVPFPFSAPGAMSGELAFVGFGISAPEANWDDYAGYDVTGKVLLMLRFEPRLKDPDSPFQGPRASRHALFRTKARVAAEKGAAGVIIVNPPGHAADADELYQFSIRRARRSFEIPMIHVTQEVAETLLAAAEMPDLKTLTGALENKRAFQSRDMNLHAEIDTGLVEKQLETRNVIALLPGSTPTREVIVVGAHYDHLGVNFSRDGVKSIYNGADDNASGTCGLLELARHFSLNPPARGLLFIAFSAEEMGLLGSKHFVANPTVQFDRIKAMVNMDMIGRYGMGKTIVYGGRTAEEFPGIIDRNGAAVQLEYDTKPARRGIFGRSDHASFYDKDVPVMFPFTGLHAQYHRPQDDWELVDVDGATVVMEFTYRCINDIANLENGPTYRDRNGSDEAREGPGPIAADDDQATPLRRPRVRLGIMPSYDADDEPGMRVEAVLRGMPAEAAGMKDGDRIVKLDGRQIDNIADLMRALAGRNPNDEIPVIVKRGEEDVTLNVKLTAAGPSGE